MSFKEKIGKKTGIALISLVVTIIVLIILASISISMITGENGILKRANDAKEQAQIAKEKEIIESATIQTISKNKYGNVVESELQDELDKITANGKTEVTDIGEEFEVVFKENKRYYKVDKEGTIEGAYKIVEDKYPGNITFGINGEILDGNTEETAYEIWCIEDLVEWSKNYEKYNYSHIKLCTNLNFKSKLSYANSQTKNYGDINLDGKEEYLITELQKGEGFMPIQYFSGTFNGNGYIINNIYISKTGNAGFIIELRNEASIKNFTLEGEISSTSGNAGIISQVGGNVKIENVVGKVKIYAGVAAGMVGNCTGKIDFKNCINFGNISASSAAGGLCGDRFGGEMLNCINKGTIKSSGSSNYGVGGLCGNNLTNSIIKNCLNLGEITYDGNKEGVWYFGGTGGIIGLNRNKLTIQNCINMGKIQSKSYGGAICGMDFTYWKSGEIYELTNSFMLDNVDKITGSNNLEREITVFAIEELEDIKIALNQYIINNELIKSNWRLWDIKEGCLTFDI